MSNVYTWEHVKKVYEHPEILCWLCGKNKHTKLHGSWIKYIWANNSKEHLLFAHRASMKTTAITEIGTIWRLMFNPEERVFIMRKTWGEASENLRNIQSMMMIPEVSELLRCAWFGPESSEKWHFTQSREGRFNLSVKKNRTKETSVMGFGVDSALVGYHNTAGVVDDAVTLVDRLSKAERERTKIVFRELRANIIERPFCWGFTGTPYVDGNEDTGDAYKLLPSPWSFPAKSTGLLTDEQLVDIRKKTTGALFSINYNLTFDEAEDQPFRDPVMGEVDWSQFREIVCHLDASYSGDHTSALTFMARTDDNKIVATGFTDPGNVKDWIPFILKQMKHFKPRKFFAETNADRGFVMDIIKAQPEFQALHCWTSPYREDMKKDVKIATYLKESWENIMWDTRTVDDNYLAQITTYLEGQEPDDCADSASSLLRESNFSQSRNYMNILKAWNW